MIAVSYANQTFESDGCTTGTAPSREMPNFLLMRLKNFNSMIKEFDELKNEILYKLWYLKQSNIFHRIYQEHRYSIILSLLFNIFYVFYHYKMLFSKSGFVAAVARQHKN